MTSGLDEVETSVNAVVDDLLPVDTILLVKVRIEPRLDVIDNGLPAGIDG